MTTPTSIASASRPLPLPPNGTSVSARAMPIDTAVNATTSDNTSDAVRQSTAHLQTRDATRTFDQFLGHGLNPTVRITLVTNMAAEPGAVPAGLRRRFWRTAANVWRMVNKRLSVLSLSREVAEMTQAAPWGGYMTKIASRIARLRVVWAPRCCWHWLAALRSRSRAIPTSRSGFWLDSRRAWRPTSPRGCSATSGMRPGPRAWRSRTSPAPAAISRLRRSPRLRPTATRWRWAATPRW